MKPKTKKVVKHISDNSDDSELEIQITTEVSIEESQDSESDVSDKSEKEVKKTVEKNLPNA